MIYISNSYSLKHSVFWAVRAFVNFKLVLYISKAHKIFELSGIRARAVSVSGFIKLRQWYMMTRRLQILDGIYELHSTYNFRKHRINFEVKKIQTYKFHNELTDTTLYLIRFSILFHYDNSFHAKLMISSLNYYSHNKSFIKFYYQLQDILERKNIFTIKAQILNVKMVLSMFA